MISSENVTEVQSNSTFSDDEEQFVECQSFGDLSNRNSLNSSDVLMKTVGGNVTITRESGQGDDNGTFDAGLQNLNSSEIPVNGTFDACTLNLNSTNPAVNATFDAGSPNQNSTETVANGTFEAGTPNLNSTNTAVNGTYDAGSQNLNSTQTAVNVTFDQLEPRVSTESSENFGSCSPGSKAAGDVAQHDTDFSEQELQLPEETHCVPKVEPEEPMEQDDDVSKVHQDESIVTSPDADRTLQVIQTVLSPEQVQIDEVNTVESTAPQESSAQEAEEYFHNIDDNSRSQSNATAVRMESTFSPESQKQEVKENPLSPVSKGAENVFVDKVQGQFNVEFKKPAAPVFKASTAETFAENEFNCGSSCKNQSERCGVHLLTQWRVAYQLLVCARVGCVVTN